MGLFGSLSWALAQRILWLGRANNAWGSSRVWNAGTSFETDSATWQGRANTAYDSGVWGSGNTWQADYNAALAATLNQSSVAISGSMPAGGVWAQIAAPLTGHYAAYFDYPPNTGQTGAASLSIRLAGAAQWTRAFSCNTSSATTYGGGVELDATAGQLVDLFVNSFSGSNGSASTGTLHLTFIPTPTHPH